MTQETSSDPQKGKDRTGIKYGTQWELVDVWAWGSRGRRQTGRSSCAVAHVRERNHALLATGRGGAQEPLDPRIYSLEAGGAGHHCAEIQRQTPPPSSMLLLQPKA